MTMNVGNSSLKKGETILDTAMSLKRNAPRYYHGKTSGFWST